MAKIEAADRLTFREVRDIAQDLIVSMPDTPSTLSLFGSTARDDHTSRSDVDLLAITNGFYVTKQNRRLGKNNIQIVAGSFDAFSARIMRAPRDRNPFLLNIVDDALILVGDEQPLANLKVLSAKIRSRGPQPVELDRVRGRLSQCMDARDKMLYGSNDMARAAAAMRAVVALQGCVAIKSRVWLSMGLSRNREFHSLFPVIGQALEHDTINGLRSGTFERLAATISRILEEEFPMSSMDETAFAI